MIPELSADSLAFPSLHTALKEPNGLLAYGGDLSTERLIAAYKQGIFPWYSEPDPILWWSPAPRCILRPNSLRISRSLNKSLRNKGFEVTYNRCFENIIKLCAKRPKPLPNAQFTSSTSPSEHHQTAQKETVIRNTTTANTWITSEMVSAYCQLHEQGIAHSVEIWLGDALVGGLYGLSIGCVFFGESMFSKTTDASKVALVHLTEQLKTCGFSLIDCQVSSPHLHSLGAVEIDRNAFLVDLKYYINQNPLRNPWHAHPLY